MSTISLGKPISTFFIINNVIILEHICSSNRKFLVFRIREAIHGKRGSAILMYPFNARYPSEFEQTLCHELGHILFSQNNHVLHEKLQHVKFLEDGGIAVFGLSVWSEFIAECIANLVFNNDPNHIFFPKQEQLIHLLYEALPGLDTSNTARARKSAEFFLEGYHLNQYALGHYYATF